MTNLSAFLNALFRIVFLLGVYCQAHGQSTVPPVQRSGGSASMTITPDPNDTTQGQQGGGNPLPNLTSGGGVPGSNALTVIVDHSGSMLNGALAASRNSSAILGDLIEIWGTSLYPKVFKDLQFQYIEFGDLHESNVLIPLGPIQNAAQIRQQILNSPTSYGGTDFSAGINPAVQTLMDSLYHRTLFLTDAGDGGAGATQGAGYYAALDDIKFVIYDAANASVASKGWLSVTNASEFHVENEFEVLSVFVQTLFEFVDNLNNYLVRQGEKKIGVGTPFVIQKHSPTESNNTIVSKPASATGIQIKEVLDPVGNVVDPPLVRIDETATFFNVVLDATLPKGDYQLVFEPSTLSRTHYLDYISFERCQIELQPELSPDPGSGCFLENSAVNFQFKYMDVVQGVQITYPDFLSHAAYRYAMIGQPMDVSGQGNQGLLFTHSFPFGTAGRYEVRSVWSYNESKLQQGDPKLALVEQVCVDQNGSLVRLDYDTTQTWEGREIEFTATILEPKPGMKQIKKLPLQLGGGAEIPLRQDSANALVYRGTLDYVERGRDYVLSIGKITNYNLAFDSTAATAFRGRERYIQITVTAKDFSALRQDVSVSNFFKRVWQSLNFVLSDLGDETFVYAGESLKIPYQLPYYEAERDSIDFVFSLNKVFPDETVRLSFQLDSTRYTYAAEDVETLWLKVWPFTALGAPKRSQDLSDAVMVQMNFTDSLTIMQPRPGQQSLWLAKRAGTMTFTEALFPEPSFAVSGNLSFGLKDGSTRTVTLPNNHTELAIETSLLDKRYTLLRWRLNRILLLFLLLFIGVLYLLPAWIGRRKNQTKVRLWRRLVRNESLLPTDLWYSPERNSACNPQLKLPDPIKAAFPDEYHQPSYAEYAAWLQTVQELEQTNRKKAASEIKSKLCYTPIYKRGGIVRAILLAPFFPIVLLLDVWRRALDRSPKVVRNADFLAYVRDVENLTIPNVPSTFSFSGEGTIRIRFQDPATNAVRLREMNVQGKVADLSFGTDQINLVAFNYALTAHWRSGESEYIAQNGRATSPKHLSEFGFEVDEKLYITVREIDFETQSCVVHTEKL